MAPNLEYYYYGQGEVMIARRTAGAGPTKWFKAWDVSALTLALTVESFAHRESMTGQKLEVRKIITGKSGTLNMTMHNISAANVALALHGEENVVIGGSVTGEKLPTVESGDILMLDYPGVSDLTITDNGGTPQTLPDTAYELDPTYGQINILELPESPALVQPFTAAYMHGGVTRVAMFNTAAPEIALRYKGINLAENGAPVMVDIYRMATDPLSELAFINNEQALAGMPMAGTILADATKPANGPLGQFGNIAWLQPVA